MINQRPISFAPLTDSIWLLLRRLIVLLAAAASFPANATYWNVFNIEGERDFSAEIVTYATLADMLGDVNRTGRFEPDPLGFGRNIVGSGADILIAPPPVGVPEPGTLWLIGLSLLVLTTALRTRRGICTAP